MMTLTRPATSGGPDQVADQDRSRATTELTPPKRIRTSEVAVGGLVTLLFALGAVMWHLHSIERVPALAVATAIERGATVERADLRIVYVPRDGAPAHLDTDRIDSVLGRVALVDLPAGSLLTPSLVADAATVGEGQAIVGLSLDPGAYPALGLAPGDHIDVVRGLDIAALDDSPSVIAGDATVFAVDELSSDRLLVSILTDQDSAQRVAASATAGDLRLVMVTR
jgi:hypothetical protein